MTVLDQISAQVQDQLGIYMGPQKGYLLASRLEKLRTQEGVDLDSFLRDLMAGNLGALDALSRHMTTNHTYFFREAEHFSFLRDRLVETPTRGFRIWSAAGSSGEEAYSLAMVLAEAGLSDYLILVSDVNRDVLRLAKDGRYDGAKTSRVPAALSRKYLVGDPKGFRVHEALRQRLRFQHVNLTQDWDLDAPLDAIFCRNVFIYFDAATITRVLDRLVASLRPGGWLFLGQTEGFHLPKGTRRVGAAIYQKTGGVI